MAQQHKATLTTTPQTLAEAHEALGRIRPAANASLGTWRVFRQQAARVYADVADIDRFHHHEALYWAGIEREKADGLRRKLRLGGKEQGEVQGEQL